MRIKVPRLLATILSFLLLFAVIISIVFGLVPLVKAELQHLQGIDPTKFSNLFDQQIYYIEALLIENDLSQQSPGFLKKLLIDELSLLVNSDNAGSIISGIFNGISQFIIA